MEHGNKHLTITSLEKQFAGIGMVYDATKDKFISAQTHDSWALDGNDDWQKLITK